MQLQLPCSSLKPETLPDLMARRTVVLFVPVALAASANVYGMALRLDALIAMRHAARRW